MKHYLSNRKNKKSTKNRINNQKKEEMKRLKNQKKNEMNRLKLDANRRADQLLKDENIRLKNEAMKRNQRFNQSIKNRKNKINKDRQYTNNIIKGKRMCKDEKRVLDKLKNNPAIKYLYSQSPNKGKFIKDLLESHNTNFNNDIQKHLDICSGRDPIVLPKPNNESNIISRIRANNTNNLNSSMFN